MWGRLALLYRTFILTWLLKYVLPSLTVGTLVTCFLATLYFEKCLFVFSKSWHQTRRAPSLLLLPLLCSCVWLVVTWAILRILTALDQKPFHDADRCCCCCCHSLFNDCHSVPSFMSRIQRHFLKSLWEWIKEIGMKCIPEPGADWSLLYRSSFICITVLFESAALLHSDTHVVVRQVSYLLINIIKQRDTRKEAATTTCHF